MDARDIHEDVTRIFRSVFDDASLSLHPTTTANDIADWTSLTHVHLVVAMEECFGIRFLSGELQDLQDVGEFESLIARKLAHRPTDAPHAQTNPQP